MFGQVSKLLTAKVDTRLELTLSGNLVIGGLELRWLTTYNLATNIQVPILDPHPIRSFFVFEGNHFFGCSLQQNHEDNQSRFGEGGSNLKTGEPPIFPNESWTQTFRGSLPGSPGVIAAASARACEPASAPSLRFGRNESVAFLTERNLSENWGAGHFKWTREKKKTNL